MDLSLLGPVVASALLILVLGTVIGLSRFYFVGTKKETYGTLTPGHKHGPSWYANINRTYINGIESFALFAPAVILHLVIQSEFLSLLGTIAWIYFLARVLYTIIYALGGYKIYCSFVWLVSFACTLIAWVLVWL